MDTHFDSTIGNFHCMKKTLTILIILLTISSVLPAQKNVRVYGYVIDSDNRGMESANVFVENTTTNTLTNSNGYYDLNLKVKDSVVLVYSQIGYQTIRHTIHSRQQVVQISVQLQALSKQITIGFITQSVHLSEFLTGSSYIRRRTQQTNHQRTFKLSRLFVLNI